MSSSRAADEGAAESSQGTRRGNAAATGSGKGKAAGEVPSAKPKQPNQYTYRKERAALAAAAAVANGNRPSSPTPSPSKSGRRAVGAGAGGSTLREGTGSRAGTPSLSSSHAGAVAGLGKTNSSWGLPDHLSHLAHLLPSPHPEPLSVQLPSTKGLPHSHDNNGSATRPSPHAFTLLDLPEQPTKVRFPGKRMTMGEMRKRVRGISDYITRTQLEALERGKRMKMLGIEAGGSRSGSGSASSSKRDSPAGAAAGKDMVAGGEVDGSAAEVAQNGEAAAGTTPTPQSGNNGSNSNGNTSSVDPPSMRLLDDLTRELIAFQQKYGMLPGGGGGGGGGGTAHVPLPAVVAVREESQQGQQENAVAAAAAS